MKSRGQILTELRRSNAAGLHIRRYNRGNENRSVIEQGLREANMAVDYLDDVEEPSLAELADIEADEYDDEWEDDDDYYFEFDEEDDDYPWDDDEDGYDYVEDEF